jgi:undecaprenyl-phosphate 4-deoxy-4-formamido-L-arabinose transferase
MRRISVVVPVYNGAETLPKLIEQLDKHLRPQNSLELILVNDGSTRDNSDEVCEVAAQQNDWIVYIELSTNFGEHNAVMAGLNHCTGDYVVIMDDDLQNPPHEAIRLVDELDRGDYDVVFSCYKKKKHGLSRNLGSSFNNLIASYVLKKPRDLYLSSFKCIRRSVVKQIIKYDGPYPYIDGLILRSTTRYGRLEVEHFSREVGRSGYSLRKLVSLWLNMFTNFSILPLRIASAIGLLLATLSGLAGVVVIIEKIMNPDLPTGWASVFVAILFMSSVQLLAIGLMGEYLGRVLMKLNKIPQFVVRRTIRNKEQA